MIKVLNVVGARPNFMKIAPIHSIMQKSGKFNPVLVHTGQHYDEKMSKFFFNDLGLPEPDVYLGVGSGSHAVQTANIMVEFEKVVIAEKPDWVLVVGDVNSTIACGLVASKLGVPIIHVEAGLRSFDRTMPEEINRILTDSISDLLFITEKSGIDNLIKEGVSEKKIHFVGNVMIDSLINNLKKAQSSDILERLGVADEKFGLITLHRPSNVDDKENLTHIFSMFYKIQKDLPLIFPIHPRTRKNIETFGLDSIVKSLKNIKLTPPLGYLEFLKLQQNAAVIFTDSGGIQEESTYLQVPCLTMRENTERPITIELGTNELVGLNEDKIFSCFEKIMNGSWKKGVIPPLWDGRTAHRIVEIIDKRS
ncbi:MAG: UDP-N-acetylglucosamine 2-epimerase (non-hydrolyzing) [Calditrichia bacterium]